MDINAAADAPVAEEAISEQVAEQTPEEQQDAELLAVYERGNKPEAEAAEESDAEEGIEEVEGEEVAEAEAVEEVKAPSDIPQTLRAIWKDIPETAREAIQKDRNDLNRRLSDAGRQIQGISPIRDVLVQAVKQYPAMANLQPQEVAQQVFHLAGISQKFETDPVGTMMGLIQQHNMGQAVFQALSGQNPTQDAQGAVALQNRINQLEQQLQRATSPDYLREQVTSITTQERTMGDIQQFAANAEHWAEMEEHLPQVIPLAQQKLGEGAASAAVLEAAYNMALEIFKPDAKAQEAAPKAVSNDADAAARALKAKSVNVSSSSSGKPRKMTEDEELRRVYETVSKR